LELTDRGRRAHIVNRPASTIKKAIVLAAGLVRLRPRRLGKADENENGHGRREDGRLVGPVRRATAKWPED
jgi:hypothetical protein